MEVTPLQWEVGRSGGRDRKGEADGMGCLTSSTKESQCWGTCLSQGCWDISLGSPRLPKVPPSSDIPETSLGLWGRVGGGHKRSLQVK